MKDLDALQNSVAGTLAKARRRTGVDPTPVALPKAKHVEKAIPRSRSVGTIAQALNAEHEKVSALRQELKDIERWKIRSKESMRAYERAVQNHEVNREIAMTNLMLVRRQLREARDTLGDLRLRYKEKLNDRKKIIAKVAEAQSLAGRIAERIRDER